MGHTARKHNRMSVQQHNGINMQNDLDKHQHTQTHDEQGTLIAAERSMWLVVAIVMWKSEICGK